MGGSGVIDLERLYDEKDLFGFISEQLSYPEEVTLYDGVLEEIISPAHPSYTDLKTFVDGKKGERLQELQTKYTEIFDFQEDATLFMTYVKFEDSKGRGQMLARLKVLYEMFGLKIPEGELGDLLPLMCEFIYVSDWRGDTRAQQSFSLLLAILEDGSYHLMHALKKYDNIYYHLIRGMREIFKACIVDKEAASND
ncbi:MAG TPA: molecular chaperone TorD family protein [Pseudogracilibacillus sp.]|nr:molecular chaperone TorD family protein [Pseudogracilibacillus sp.]